MCGSARRLVLWPRAQDIAEGKPSSSISVTNRVALGPKPFASKAASPSPCLQSRCSKPLPQAFVSKSLSPGPCLQAPSPGPRLQAIVPEPLPPGPGLQVVLVVCFSNVAKWK